MTRTLLANMWTYVISLSLTVFTSLFTVVLSLIATKTSIDISRLSTIPSLAPFLFIVFARGLGLETLDDRYLYTVAALLSTLVIALGVTIATTA